MWSAINTLHLSLVYFFHYTLYNWLKFIWVLLNYVCYIYYLEGFIWILTNQRVCNRVLESVLLVFFFTTWE